MTVKKILSLFVLIFFSASGIVFSNEKVELTSLGNKDSKVIIKVFSSLTCPHCANFHKKIFKKLKQDFIDTNIVRYEHHGFPLDLAALNGEKILNCVQNGKKRIELLNEIYDKQDDWASGSDINNINSNLSKIAKKHGLNNDRINNCLKDENIENEILNERIMAQKKYSIESTPTIFINEKKYDGKHSYNDFKIIIEKIL